MNEDDAQSGAAGPLNGITVIEMAGLGPAPLAALMLAEMGARVLRIERKDEKTFLGLPEDLDYNKHGRSILRVDLKRPEAAEIILALLEKSDVLIEGFRPGVMERLGLGPEAALKRNPRLVYGRVTGFGQTGPLAQRAGHDLTYLAYSGVLSGIGLEDSRPVPPINLIGDYGGGTMFLLTGVLAALIERSKSGKGQVVDAAMIDGVLGLALPLFAYMAAGQWQDHRASNLLDSGAPFYDTYETADGGFMAVACLEPQFFAEFARLLPLDQRFAADQYNRAVWPEMRDEIAIRIRQRNRDDWAALFEPTDACVAPVLSFQEARSHPHNVARATHVALGRLTRPVPAPRLSRTGLVIAKPQAAVGAIETLKAFGLDDCSAAVEAGLFS